MRIRKTFTVIKDISLAFLAREVNTATPLFYISRGLLAFEAKGYRGHWFIEQLAIG